jgi:hypothetical protein
MSHDSSDFSVDMKKNCIMNLRLKRWPANGQWGTENVNIRSETQTSAQVIYRSNLGIFNQNWKQS